MGTDISYKTSRFSWNTETSRNNGLSFYQVKSCLELSGDCPLEGPTCHCLSSTHLSYRQTLWALDFVTLHTPSAQPVHFISLQSVFKITKQGEANVKDGELPRWHDSEEDLSECARAVQESGTLPERQSSLWRPEPEQPGRWWDLKAGSQATFPSVCSPVGRGQGEISF